MTSLEPTVNESLDRGELTLSLTFDSTVFLIELFGELDLATSRELEEVLQRAESTDAREIVVDLSGLDFIDSTGISLMIKQARSSRMRGDRLRFLRGTGQVHQTMTLCRLHDRLPFID